MPTKGFIVGGQGRAATRVILCLGAAVTFTGCVHLGLRTIPVDRFDHSTAVAD